LSDNFVRLTEVSSEAEAATICGYLESLGIHAAYDKGGTFPGTNTGLDPAGIGAAHAGRQEILVRTEDIDAARQALEQANEDSS
jgi:hypothetical protein